MLLFVSSTAVGALEEVNVPTSAPSVAFVVTCALTLPLMDVKGVKVGVGDAVRDVEVEFEVPVCQNEVIGVVMVETIDVLLVVVIVIDDESELELSVVTMDVDGVGVVVEKRELEGEEFTEEIQVVVSVRWELLVPL